VSAWLRRGGSGRQADGSDVTWSLAEGERGRRWRWTVSDEGRLRHVALVEIDPAGRFARLELASSAGMLTLHPEPDGRSIHGNVVATDGVRPLSFDWLPTAGLAIAGDAFGSAILRVGTGVPTLVIRPGLDVVAGEGDPALEPALERDGRGVPILSDAREWPLEA
jgi:hypothetical protein